MKSSGNFKIEGNKEVDETVVKHSSAKEPGDFIKSAIELTAKVKTDQWTGYRSLSHDFENLIQVPSGKKGNNFPDLHRAIMLFKGWLRGMHHNVEYLQPYIDEYCYRFNRSNMKEGIFENLMKRIYFFHTNKLLLKCLIQEINSDL